MKDPLDPSVRLLGNAKNNFGRSDLPMLNFSIESVVVADTEEGQVESGGICWQGETAQSIDEALYEASGPTLRRIQTASKDAAEWLEEYLDDSAAVRDSAVIKELAHKAGHSESALKLAREILKIPSLDQSMSILERKPFQTRGTSRCQPKSGQSQMGGATP